MAIDIKTQGLFPVRRDKQIATSSGIATYGSGGGGSLVIDLSSYTTYSYVDGSIALRDASIAWLNSQINAGTIRWVNDNIPVEGEIAFSNGDGSLGSYPGFSIDTIGNIFILKDLSINGTLTLSELGVACSDPHYLLQVGVTSNFANEGDPMAYFTSTDTTRLGINSDDNNSGFGLYESGILRYSVASYNGGNFTIYDDVVGASRIHCTSVGNVGIRTNNPQSYLHISGSAEAMFKYSRDTCKTWGLSADNAGTYFHNYTDSVVPLYITNAGLVKIDSIGEYTANHSLYVDSAIRYANTYKRVIVLAYPGIDVGNGKWYIRLHPSDQATLASIKITVQGTWNYVPIMGWLTAEYSYYCPGSGGISTNDFVVTSTTGAAWDYLRLGDLEVENGWISIPVWCLNSNAVNVTVEWNDSADIIKSNLTSTSWVSETAPTYNMQSINGGLHIRDVGSYLYFDTTGIEKTAGIRTVNNYELEIFTNRGASSKLILNDDGQVELYYGTSKKLETTNTGAAVTGNITATGDIIAYYS